MTTDDTDALAERIVTAMATEDHDLGMGDYALLAARVLPIVAEEVRAASERAWEECAAMAAHHGAFDGNRARWLSSINPYSATEKENA